MRKRWIPAMTVSVFLCGVSVGTTQEVRLEPLTGDIEKVIKEIYPDAGLVTIVDIKGNITALRDSNRTIVVEQDEPLNLPEANNVKIFGEQYVVYDVNPDCITKTVGGSIILISGNPNECLRQ